MNENTRLGRAQARSRRSSTRKLPAERRPLNIKWVSALMLLGIILLAGGAIFAATRPTWHPAPGEQTADASSPESGIAGVSTDSHEGIASTPAVHAQAALIGTGRALAAMPFRTRVSPPSSARSITYTVKSGDTLSGIAEWFKLHGYGRLYEANRTVIGSNPNLIIPGERITISHGAMSFHHSTGGHR